MNRRSDETISSEPMPLAFISSSMLDYYHEKITPINISHTLDENKKQTEQYIVKNVRNSRRWVNEQ